MNALECLEAQVADFKITQLNGRSLADYAKMEVDAGAT